HAPAIASANWLASAAWLGARLDEAILVDIGSTTTDLIPIRAGRPATASVSDSDRLGRGELLYSGVVRTPVCALAATAPFRGRWQTLCAEWFATAADVHRLLGDLPADADQQPSADGRGKGMAESRARLARMLGCDAADATPEEWRQVAAHLARHQLARIHDGLDQVLSAVPLAAAAPLVGAGVGRFLAARLARIAGRAYRDFATLCPAPPAASDWIADCAPAVAVGLLAARRYSQASGDSLGLGGFP
ncbi:MAG: hydantoinase/oxoprolinase family protein, partial [Candidatus Competibacterales bacterium]|nr:hydantoinase/oxoprolinase family protein [Candidatus Competibacterales bacterium]